MKTKSQPETMRCQACGRLLPASAFPKYSITRCRRCIAKTAASRRKQKKRGPGMKYILDVCCGSRMFWFNKNHPEVIYMDNRECEERACDGRWIHVKPDVKADFRKNPFEDKTFRMVVFDPPHLKRAGTHSWLAQKYGKLDPETWQEDLRSGFSECFRVLMPGGFLIFKWNEDQIKIYDVIRLAPQQPLFGQKRGKTHWLVFMKPVEY